MHHPHLTTHRLLEDYYSLEQEEIQQEQHPVMTALLLFILGSMIIASITVFCIRIYRKRFRDDCGDALTGECNPMKTGMVDLQEPPTQTQKTQPMWDNAALAQPYIDMNHQGTHQGIGV
jgi:hypothetical protein